MWTKIIISIVVGSVLAWLFGFGITEALIAQDSPTGELDLARKRQDVNRGNAYVLCALIVFACAMPIALNIPIFEKETDTFTRVLYTFIILLLPASFGVWCALPNKPNDQ